MYAVQHISFVTCRSYDSVTAYALFITVYLHYLCIHTFGNVFNNHLILLHYKLITCTYALTFTRFVTRFVASQPDSLGYFINPFTIVFMLSAC